MLDRVLYLGHQATPILNGMKFAHTHQVRLNANLTMNTIGRAAKGDRKALKDEQPSQEQIAFAALMRGVHW